MTTLRGLGTRRRAALAAGILLAIAACCAWWALGRREATLADRVYRIGADDSHPYRSVLPDGRIEGSNVDILNEAARRAGIRLQWTPFRDLTGLHQALLSGELDISIAAKEDTGQAVATS